MDIPRWTAYSIPNGREGSTPETYRKFFPPREEKDNPEAHPPSSDT